MKKTNFERVSDMNVAFGNPNGNPLSISLDRVRSQTRNILDEFCEIQLALGASQEAVDAIRVAAKGISYPNDVDLDGVRDGLCDVHVFAYGAHHLMGLDADRDMDGVVSAVMTRFIKDEADKQATIAKHAAKGVTEVYFEGDFPTMVMKSAVDQPDAPKGKFLKSASYCEPDFYPVSARSHERPSDR
jgi:predicted HAD superfamily Cof-like phosphohydrolase